MDRHAEIGLGLDQLAVLRAVGGQTGLVPVREPWLGRDTQLLASHRDRLIDSRFVSVDNQEVGRQTTAVAGQSMFSFSRN